MKIVLYYIFIVILLLLGVGLLSLANKGILSLDKPYGRGLMNRLEPQSPVVAFRNVNVIPMDSERVLEDQIVIVRDGVIEMIGFRDQVRVPDDALVVDGQGKCRFQVVLKQRFRVARHPVDEVDARSSAVRGQKGRL